MSRRNHDPWRDYHRDREDISVAVAFFLTFALLGIIGWVIFFGTGWIVPAAVDSLPLSSTRVPSTYTTSSVADAGISFPITSSVPALVSAGDASAPQPPATPTPAPTATRLRIGNTGGDGVYLRRSPGDNDLWIPWPDNTIVEYLNEDQQANNRTYKKVRDPRGNTGWVPAEYLQPS